MAVVVRSEPSRPARVPCFVPALWVRLQCMPSLPAWRSPHSTTATHLHSMCVPCATASQRAFAPRCRMQCRSSAVQHPSATRARSFNHPSCLSLSVGPFAKPALRGAHLAHLATSPFALLRIGCWHPLCCNRIHSAIVRLTVPQGRASRSPAPAAHPSSRPAGNHPLAAVFRCAAIETIQQSSARASNCSDCDWLCRGRGGGGRGVAIRTLVRLLKRTPASPIVKTLLCDDHHRSSAAHSEVFVLTSHCTCI